MNGNRNKNKSWLIKIVALAIIVFFNGVVFGNAVMAQDPVSEDLDNIGPEPTMESIEDEGDPFGEGIDDMGPAPTAGSETGDDSAFSEGIDSDCGNEVIDPGEECDDGEGQGDDVDRYLNPEASERERQFDSCFKCEYVDVPYEFNVTKYLKIAEGQTYLEKSEQTDSGVNIKKGVIYFIITGIEFATKIISAFALLFIIAGGIVLMVSSGNSSLQQKGKRLILYSILGLVIAFLSLIIVTSVQSIFYTT